MKKKIIILLILSVIFIAILIFFFSRTTFYIMATVEDVNDFAGTAIVYIEKQIPSELMSSGSLQN